MSFKLLAIRPLDKCNKIILKNLEENRIYQFYNDYKFLDQKDEVIKDFGKGVYKEVKMIEYKETVPVDLYSQGKLKINVSAIVGKNGSGKSALTELLYGALYSYSIKNVDGFSARYKSIVVQCELFFCHHYMAYDKEAIDYYVLKIKNSKAEIYSLNGGTTKYFEDYLFYSIASNYSLYGLNSDVIGEWIQKLFHKNDGYQAPIVLNPMRTSGIIDVNREYDLANDRLLSNILNSDEIDKNSRNILHNKRVNKINLKLKEKKIKLFHKDRTNKKEYLKKYLKLIFDAFKSIEYEENIDEKKINEIINTEHEVVNYATDYLLYKLKKVAKNYSKEGTNFKAINYENEDSVKSFLNNIKLYDNGVHITFKIRRLLNFLKNDIYEKKHILEYNDRQIDLLKKKISEFRNRQIDLYLSKVSDNGKKKFDHIFLPFLLLTNIELIPPPIYDVDYEFEQGGKFSLLSSGETQIIFSINTVIYHLINLSSKHNGSLFKFSDDENTDLFNSRKDIKYQYVNIIFDEIELCFHPQMQKEFLSEILKKINSTYLSGLKAINILFITHSPFILSDIPKQNVLFLSDGKPEKFKKKNTFGANITDLLLESFFFSDANEHKLLIGDFAKNKIDTTIKWLNDMKNETDESKINGIEKAKHKRIIDLIDEPLIRTKLTEMYYEVFDEEYLLEKEKEYIKKRAIELGIIKE